MSQNTNQMQYTNLADILQTNQGASQHHPQAQVPSLQAQAPPLQAQAPPHHSDWHILQMLHQLPLDPHASQTVVSERGHLLHRIEIIAETRCPECQGFGHGYKSCSTRKRLLKLSHGVPVWRSLLNQARVRTGYPNSATLLGKRMRWV